MQTRDNRAANENISYTEIHKKVRFSSLSQSALRLKVSSQSFVLHHLVYQIWIFWRRRVDQARKDWICARESGHRLVLSYDCPNAILAVHKWFVESRDWTSTLGASTAGTPPPPPTPTKEAKTSVRIGGGLFVRDYQILCIIRLSCPRSQFFPVSVLYCTEQKPNFVSSQFASIIIFHSWFGCQKKS